jgi:predicted ATP-dependent endonuclease of OLD family
MYIARIRVQNYRCFQDSTIEFQPGLNVIIGENNAGKPRSSRLSRWFLIDGRKADQ